MTSTRTIEDSRRDTVAYADKAWRFLADVPSAAALSWDGRTLLAVVRALEVIAEVAKQVPKAFPSKHPQVPWRAMVGMRDKVTHGYFGLDEEVVWRPVQEDLPPVRRAADLKG